MFMTDHKIIYDLKMLKRKNNDNKEGIFIAANEFHKQK